jgi:hypothetical protein
MALPFQVCVSNISQLKFTNGAPDSIEMEIRYTGKQGFWTRIKSDGRGYYYSAQNCFSREHRPFGFAQDRHPACCVRAGLCPNKVLTSNANAQFQES